MLTGHFEEVPQDKPHMPGADATIRWLISKKQGAPNFAMRVIELAKMGDKIPLHGHPYEHEIFVIEGTGRVVRPGGEEAVGAGKYVYVAKDEQHGFANDGEEPFRFICVIPNSGDTRP